ncbi:cutinase-domain-containing protein [Emericellopsis atlantica]|uniref:Cutinase n=1 Tax=Emericellopsis atlantica TaxID=2614577 RepID=A0A9P7ZF66_9HYPO|nr:cutinase-domain-containing protein [Emericellopsis atlantica]KAG9250988.1 cutinase-domain-containing protein [Emericellopsis atlantica]
MKFFIAATTLLAGSAMAAPAVDLEERQLGSITRNDLEDGSAGDCPEAIFIFARATGEPGNMGASAGPAVAGTLEREISSVWIQGVGGPYDATVGDNVGRLGTSQEAIDEMTRLFNMAHDKCPDSAVVTGGYSQGTAVVAGSVSTLDAAVQEQVKGAVLFGYTKNRQNNEQIPNYPTDRTEIFCNPGDLVCEGSLIVAAPHFAYTTAARGPAADFLVQQINSA